MAQLGPIQPPITGPTPTDVPGENQISGAYTSVRDDGLPGGRGLVRSQPCNPSTHPVAFLLSLHSQYPLCRRPCRPCFWASLALSVPVNLHHCHPVDSPHVLH